MYFTAWEPLAGRCRRTHRFTHKEPKLFATTGTRSGREPPDMATEGIAEPTAEKPLPPGPNGLPVLGSAVSLMRDPETFIDELAGYGDVVRYRAGRNRFTALLHPDHIEHVLVANPERFERWALADAGVDIVDEGVLSTGGTQWRRQRQIMQPAFTVDRIGTYAPVMERIAAETAAGWTDGDVIDLSATFRRLSLRILARTLFDLALDPEADEAGLVAITEALEEATGPSLNLTMMLPDWIDAPAERRLNRAVERYHERLDGMIDERRASGTDGRDLLSILLSAESPDGHRLDEDELRDNLLTFLIAGHETTALALGYTVMCLAEHPDEAAGVRRALADLDDSESGVREDCDPLEGAIAESLRLYPPAPVMFRRATAEAEIGGYRIPAGTILTLPIFHVHRDPRFYHRPDTFDPGRWTPSFRKTLPEYAFFPFGGGPRHCIGMRFAMLELRTVLATILPDWEFELLSNPEPDLRRGITLRPDEPIVARVHRR